jgi:hypothetical protein
VQITNTRLNENEQSRDKKTKNPSSLIKMIKGGIMGTKRTRDDPEIAQVEHVSKKLKPTLEKPTPNIVPNSNSSDISQRETKRFRH